MTFTNAEQLCEYEQEIMITMRLNSCISIIPFSTKADLLFLNVQPLITSLIRQGGDLVPSLMLLLSQHLDF